MSPGAGARKRLGGVAGVVGVGGGFALGCGCRDAKAVAVAASSTSASPYSSATATDTSTATTASWRGARAAPHHPSSASGSTGTLTVPSASSSSFLWEDADGDAGEEVDCKQREGPAATASFSGLLRQLNELEQSVVSWGRKSTSKDCLSPPLPPPPPVPARPVKQRVAHSGGDSKEGQGNFSPPRPPPTSFQLQTTQQHRKAKNLQAQPPPPPPPPPLPLPPEQPLKAKSTVKGGKKEGASIPPTSQAAAPKHRKAKSCDGGGGRLDGTVAVVKQSDDPLSDFRRSMVNMVVENRIATGDELRELLRHFLALNAPHHHDTILRAFTEIWDEAFSAKTGPRGPAARQTPPRLRPKAPTPPRRRHDPPPRVWR
ncbi:hypothetical protein GQ55_7G254900 [Panicum hallii var. hallii]|uniref:Transcription repressor n=1 Tax=Panicum hallii var. hallii TaxID=1504633 RepID=A0A2T7CZ02_9POAL|nr:hypothetical protein GQ55_7G254900 [Panicum hallii var. hallii]